MLSSRANALVFDSARCWAVKTSTAAYAHQGGYRERVEKRGKDMPTIEEVLIQTIEALEASGFTAGGAVYDDFAQAVKQLQDGDSVKERLSA